MTTIIKMAIIMVLALIDMAVMMTLTITVLDAIAEDNNGFGTYYGAYEWLLMGTYMLLGLALRIG